LCYNGIHHISSQYSVENSLKGHKIMNLLDKAKSKLDKDFVSDSEAASAAASVILGGSGDVDLNSPLAFPPGADLSGATFRGADLSGATFRGADLSGATFRGADLSGATFRGADLSGSGFIELQEKSNKERFEANIIQEAEKATNNEHDLSEDGPSGPSF
jgi:uncharacterized protein YjbI with pentapeptide repeats